MDSRSSRRAPRAQNEASVNKNARDAIRVVVVEDLVPLRKLLVSALTLEGFEVRAAGSVAEGLTVVEQGEVDVVVTDHYLPDGTGSQLVARARMLRPHLKALCISGTPQLSPTFDASLEKPFTVEALAQTIRGIAAR